MVLDRVVTYAQGVGTSAISPTVAHAARTCGRVACKRTRANLFGAILDRTLQKLCLNVPLVLPLL